MRKLMLPIVAVFLALGAASAAARQSAPFTPEDMLQLTGFVGGSEPALSPDGALAAYSVVDVSDERNIRAARPTGVLWVKSTTDEAPARRLGAPGAFGVQPVWSPDSGRLAFVQTHDSGSRLAVWERESNRLRVLGPPLGTDRAALPVAGLSPRWTPDGQTIILAVADEPPPPEEAPRVRVLKSTDAIVPGDAFFTNTRRWRLLAITVASGQARTLTPESIALRGFDLSPDGRYILYRAVTPESLGRFRQEQIETWLVPVSGSEPPRLALGTRRAPWITFSPIDGRLIYPEGDALYAQPLGGGEPARVVSGLPQRCRAPIANASSRVALLCPRPGTGPSDSGMYSILRPVDDLVVVDLESGRTTTLTAASRDDELADVVWSGDGSTLFFRAIDQATYAESIRRWQPGMDAPAQVLSAEEALGNVSPSRDGTLVAFTAMSATRPEDGYLVTAAGDRRRLTELNPQVERFRFVAPERFSYYSADGDPLHALLFMPSGASADAPVPVVTYVYEKLSPQVYRFNPEAQLHVSHGYGYLMPDVLVKPGYTGESFVKSVVPAVNAVRAKGITNGRFGITGGSFGGYAGLFLISHVDIFSAAVVRAPPSEFFSTWGDGRDRDIYTIERGQARTGGTPWEVPERYIANSPFFHADRVRTPVLILHGEKDFTVPFQQGEMMFYALRALGRTAEFAIYREGDHSIVRGSRHDFLDYYNRTLEWWNRYLGGRIEETPGSGSGAGVNQ